MSISDAAGEKKPIGLVWWSDAYGVTWNGTLWQEVENECLTIGRDVTMGNKW